MTIGELIEKLQTYDPSLLVAVDHDVYDDWVETEFRFEEGIYGHEGKQYGWFYTLLDEPSERHRPCLLILASNNTEEY